MRHNLLPIALLLAAVGCGGGSDSPSSPGTPTTPATPIVASVTVTGTASVEAGKTVKLSAEARDAAGALVSGKTFTWSSANESVASVASDGTVTGKTAGTASINASVDGKTGSLAVTVSPSGPSVSTVTISGASTLEAGTTTKLVATLKDASGATLTNIRVSWSSSDASLMSVAGDGTLTAARIATVTITAAAGGKSGTMTVTSTLAPFTFNLSEASATDAQLIRDGVQQAMKFFQTSFGRVITGPTTIVGSTTSPACAQGGSAAATTAGTAIFCVGNQGWTVQGPISKQKITIHEVFHLWQFQSRWLGAGPAPGDWLNEGAAELVGYSAIDALGLLPLSTTRGCSVKEVTDFANSRPPGLPPLGQLESHQAWQTTQGPTYPWAMMGVDKLTSAGGIVTLKTFADAFATPGVTWQSAFQTAFGQSLTDFYAAYPGYFASLPVPAQYVCRV